MTLLLNREGTHFERVSPAPFDAPVLRDQTTILGLSLGEGRSRLLIGSTSYEDGATNQPCVLAYDFPAQRSPADFPSHTSSVGPMALADVDGDGDLDLFVGGQVIPGQYPRAASSLLFRQTQERWSLDVEGSRVLSQAGLVNGAVWSDLDDDGFPELILACEWGPIRVFHNRAGSLREVTREWELAAYTGLWTGVTTGDIDGDGRLDIVAGNWGFNSLYQASAPQPMTLYFGDLAGNGATDILETEWDPARQELVPRHLREVLQVALPFIAERFPTHLAWSRATIADVTGQRAGPLQKLSVTTLASTLFLNRQGKFEARPLPIEAQIAPVFGVNVADLDGDGIEDVFLTQNFFALRNEDARLDAGRSLWLRGEGQGNLTAVPGQSSGLLVYGEQRGAALADFNHDGRTDLVVTQNGAATRLFQNTGARPGLRVRLQGPTANPNGVGAVLRLRFATGWGPAREIHSGDGYWSQASPTAVLGLREKALALQVRWPGGQTSEHPVPENAREVVIPMSHSSSLAR